MQRQGKPLNLLPQILLLDKYMSEVLRQALIHLISKSLMAKIGAILLATVQPSAVLTKHRRSQPRVLKPMQKIAHQVAHSLLTYSPLVILIMQITVIPLHKFNSMQQVVTVVTLQLAVCVKQPIHTSLLMQVI